MKTTIKVASIALITVLALIQSGSAIAGETAPSDPSLSAEQPKKSCPVNFKGISISAKEANTYVEAEYGFDENCNPILIAIRYGQVADLEEPQTAITHASSELKAFTLEPHPDLPAASFTTNVCRTETWQTDFAYIPTTKVQNETTYNWGGGVLQFWGVLGRSWEYFSWWYRYNGPNQNGWWETYPIIAKGKTDASYYCNGGPFCQGGPMYYITLEGWTRVDAWGSCSGWGVYSGTVIPGGHVFYRNWKE